MLFVLFVLLFYWTRTRPPDRIYDIEIFANYAFLAMGKTGIVVLDLSDPQSPAEIDHLDTYGFTNNMDIAHNFIYVADGPDGIKILSIESLWTSGSLTQVNAYRTPGNALDVAAAGEYLYLVDSDAGLIIYQAKKGGAELQEVKRIAVENKPQQIAISGQHVFVANKKNRVFIYAIGAAGDLEQTAFFDVPAKINRYAVDGDTVYLATQKKGLLTADISAIENITLDEQVTESMLADYRVAQGGFPPGLRDTYDIAMRGNYVYVAAGRDGFYVADKSDPHKLVLVGFDTSARDATRLNILAQYVYVADGQIGLRTYASPVALTFQGKAIRGGSTGSFNDVAVRGNYAYIAAGSSGLQVADISDLAAPVMVPYNDGLQGDYATALDIQGDTLFVTYHHSGVVEYNLAESPQHPMRDGIETAITGEANDIVVTGSFAYVAGGAGGFFSIDFTDAANPIIYPLSLPGVAKGVFVLGSQAYIADGAAGFQIVSIANPAHPTLVNTIDTPGDATAIHVAKWVDESGSARTYAFVADGSTGLYIVDITDTSRPIEVARYATTSFANDVIVQGAQVFLADRDAGLLILSIERISDLQLLGWQDTPGGAQGLYLQRNAVIFVADAGRGLRVIDVYDPQQPTEIGFTDTPKLVQAIVPQGEYGYAVDGADGLWVLDLSVPESPLAISFWDTPGDARNLTVDGLLAYVADGRAGLQVVDISNKQQPVLAGAYENIRNAVDVVVNGHYAYVIADDQRLHILDLSNLENIQEIALYSTAAMPLDIAFYQNYLYIAEGAGGVEIVKVEQPRSPTPVTAGNPGLLDSQSVLISNAHRSLFVADGIYGLRILDISNPARPSGKYYFSLETGVANGLALAGNDLFMLVDQAGVYAFDIFDIASVMPIGEYVPAEASEGSPLRAVSIAVTQAPTSEVRRYIIYLPAGPGHDPGFQILDALGQLKVTQYQMYESPGEASVSQVLKSFGASAVGRIFKKPQPVPANVWNRLSYLCFGPLVFFGLSFLWLFLLAQFVLPVQGIRDSRKGFTRLLYSVIGKHGPVVFIKEGQVICRPEELKRRGPGVARVDLNSALVLERRSATKKRKPKRRIKSRARAEGPGIAFIERSETIHGAADLRSQFRLRPGIRAYTRDGIEVENPVWVIFTLGQSPEILDVTYEGERKAENLRVVKLDIDPQTSPGKKKTEKHQRMATVKAFSDELDPEDQAEIHRYVRQNEQNYYFEAARKLAARIDLQGKPGTKAKGYRNRLGGLANRWNLRENKSVQQFLDAVDTLIANPPEAQFDLRWFAYQSRCLAEQFANPKMSAFYEYLRPRFVTRYQRRLDKLMTRSGLVQPDEHKMAELSRRSVPTPEEIQQFMLDALDFYEEVQRATKAEIERLTEPENTVEIDIRQTALAYLNQITQNLLRTDFPMLDLYRPIVERHECLTKMQSAIRKFDLRLVRQLSGFLNRHQIRRHINTIEKRASALIREDEQQIEQFLDLIEIYGYTRTLRECLRKMRRTPDEQHIEACIRQAKQEAVLLADIRSKPLRKPVRQIIKWSQSLDEQEPAQFYFFADQVEALWKKTGANIQRARWHKMEKNRSSLATIEQNIQKANTRMQPANDRSEEISSSRMIQELQRLLETCPAPPKSPAPKSSREFQIGPFRFTPSRVLAAVYSKALDRDLENEFMPWTDLPVHVAAQTYRDLVSREYYDHLYQPNDAGQFNLPKLKGMMRIKMRNQGILAFRFIDHFDSRSLEENTQIPLNNLIHYNVQELKTPKVLRARGIKVIAAGFPDLFPTSRKIPEQLVETWQAIWQQRALETRAERQLQATRIINRARAQAQHEMAFTLARILRSARSDEALAIRVFQALESTARNENTRQFLPRDTIALLQSFKQWFLPGGDDQRKSMGDLGYSDNAGFLTGPEPPEDDNSTT